MATLHNNDNNNATISADRERPWAARGWARICADCDFGDGGRTEATVNFFDLRVACPAT